MITDAQGIDWMEKLDILTDGEIENMCKVTRRPGVINYITNVANLWLQVSLRSENNLKLASFFLKHKIRTGRVVLPNYIALDSVRLLRDLKESEKEHKDHLVSPVIDIKNCLKTMESLEEYLRGHIVVRGVPLYYVVISEEAVTPSLYEPETSFSSAEYEMVAHAPIIEGGLMTITFNIHMMEFWGLIYTITGDLEFWNDVK